MKYYRVWKQYSLKYRQALFRQFKTALPQWTLNKQVWKMTEMLQCHPVLALHKKKIVPAAIFLEIHRMFIKNIYIAQNGANGRRLIRKSYL